MCAVGWLFTIAVTWLITIAVAWLIAIAVAWLITIAVGWLIAIAVGWLITIAQPGKHHGSERACAPWVDFVLCVVPIQLARRWGVRREREERERDNRLRALRRPHTLGHARGM